MYLGEYLLAAALAVSQSVAPAPDRIADIHIEADDAELDRRTGITRYRGNVRITQGDLDASGDEMSLHFVDGELAEAAITGTPATLTQQVGGDDAPTRAEAREILFDIGTGIVRLRGAARVAQGGDEFASDDISYDTRAERVVAGGESGGRIQVTITPRQQDDEAEPEEPDEPEPRR